MTPPRQLSTAGPRMGRLRIRAGRVPLGKRLLFAEGRRALLTVLGVTAALLLVLVLRGIFAGAIDRVTYYIRTSPAQLIVSQAGVKTMHMSTSTLPVGAPTTVRALPGVGWVAPIGFASGTVAGPRGRQLTYLIGYDPATGRGGPVHLVAGRPAGPGEAVLDEQAAKGLGIPLGSRFAALGTSLRAVGLSTGGSSITNTTIFVTSAEFTRMRGVPAMSYLMVGVAPGSSEAVVADGIRTALNGATVQTRQQFTASEAKIVTDMSADLLKLMSTIGLLIALAVIALGLMTATLNRVRDFAVLKALGAGAGRLAATVTAQVLWTVSLAVALAIAVGEVLARLLAQVAPSVQIHITAASVAQTALGALVVGLLAALWPLRRIVGVDAATAFREGR